MVHQTRSFFCELNLRYDYFSSDCVFYIHTHVRTTGQRYLVIFYEEISLSARTYDVTTRQPNGEAHSLHLMWSGNASRRDSGEHGPVGPEIATHVEACFELLSTCDAQ